VIAPEPANMAPKRSNGKRGVQGERGHQRRPRCGHLDSIRALLRASAWCSDLLGWLSEIVNVGLVVVVKQCSGWRGGNSSANVEICWCLDDDKC
jgi:hypothetical protein